MRVVKWLMWGFVFAVFGSQKVFAQIINIENKRLANINQGFKGALDLNLEFTKNTSSIWLGGIQSEMHYKKDKSLFLFAGDLRLIVADDQSFLNKGFEHVRYGRNLSKDGGILMEAFQQVSYDVALKIKMRSLLGSGLRFGLLRKDSASINMGYAVMYEHEEISDNVTINRAFRHSIYFVTVVNIGNNVEFKSITYYQPQLVVIKDYRLSNITSFNFKISKILSFKATFSLRYDARPPEDVPSIDYSFNNGLTLSF